MMNDNSDDDSHHHHHQYFGCWQEEVCIYTRINILNFLFLWSILDWIHSYIQQKKYGPFFHYVNVCIRTKYPFIKKIFPSFLLLLLLSCTLLLSIFNYGKTVNNWQSNNICDHTQIYRKTKKLTTSELWE